MAEPRYDAADIQVLDGLDPVRKRPSMYIGGVGKDGLHHLLWELVDNSVDEAINGYASHIQVTLHEDGCSATVTDNGRGIPVAEHPKLKKSALEVILTVLHAGGKFDNKSYATSGGLHGVGASVVNALSEKLVATIKRDGKRWVQRYRKGRPTAPVAEDGDARGTGSSLYFRPDPHIFEDVQFDAELIAHRLETKAYLNGGLKLLFKDEVSGDTHTFLHEGGVQDMLDAAIGQSNLHRAHAEPLVIRREDEGLRVEVAFAWTNAAREVVGSYVNTIPTRDGGTHEQGFRDAIHKAIRAFIDTHDLQPRGVSIKAQDIREGLMAVISVFLAEPQFQGQTKDRLNNVEVQGKLDQIVRPQLEQWLHEHTSAGDAIVHRIIQAARARAASTAAGDRERIKPRTSNRLKLPGKLADCSSNDPDETELFIVEGDSAGGSAKQGRDRHHQAVLPRRGKVLNSEQASLKKVAANKELNDVVQALGCGLGADFDVSKLRYGKVILLMDADSDGHHISTLLLTYFYRWLPGLIRSGNVYLAQPPLYRIVSGKESYWALTDQHRDRILGSLRRNARPEITRFKGLGEMMPGTLFRTTMDPARRKLLKVRIPEQEQVETDRVVGELMGKDPASRFRFIMDRAADVDALDV